MNAAPQRLALTLPGGVAAQIEYQWVGVADSQAAPLVFLHEGLGSLAMWRDYPQQLCAALGRRGLVYSRPGYGASRADDDGQDWAPDFMQRHACEVLPALLAALEVDVVRQPPWLFGHSDGASIALYYAAAFAQALAGAVLLAPHILVEPVTVENIARARDAFAAGDLGPRLARYHADVDLAFRRWCSIWLAPEFASWRIDAELDAIRRPLLLVQGLEDEYGTLEQIRGIDRRVPGCAILELSGCGHAPHRDQAQRLTEAVQQFLAKHESLPA